MRRFATAPAVLAFLLIGTDAYARTLPTQPLGSAFGRPVSDGRSLVAWTSGPGRVETLDADGRRRSVSLPASCNGGVVAAGAGRLLVACPPNGFVATIYDVVSVRTGSTRRITLPDGGNAGPPTFTGIGVHWIAGQSRFREFLTRFFVNWRTGAEVRDGAAPLTPTTWPDLSFSGLARPLCAPFARRRLPADAVSGPLSTAPTVNDQSVLGPTTTDPRQRGRFLGVGACGGRLVPLGRGRVEQAQLGGGVVSWYRGPNETTSRPAIAVRRLKDGRTWTFNRNQQLIERAGRTVVLAQPTSGGFYRLSLARVPTS